MNGCCLVISISLFAFCSLSRTTLLHLLKFYKCVTLTNYLGLDYHQLRWKHKRHTNYIFKISWEGSWVEESRLKSLAIPWQSSGQNSMLSLLRTWVQSCRSQGMAKIKMQNINIKNMQKEGGNGRQRRLRRGWAGRGYMRSLW